MITRLATLLLWRSLALGCLVLGVVGAFLPVLPTTPFLLVAAWAAGQGWPKVEVWLLAHPRYGPPVRRWRDHRAVPRSAKWLASISMLASAAVLALSSTPAAVKLALPAFLFIVAWWLWCRPET